MHSPWVSRLLEKLGHQVIVANARKVRLIYESNKKNDRVDARMLAKLGRVDVSLLAPVQHRSAEAQTDLVVAQGRDALVAARTQLINAVRGVVKSSGARLPASTTAAFASKVAPLIPATLKLALILCCRAFNLSASRSTAATDRWRSWRTRNTRRPNCCGKSKE